MSTFSFESKSERGVQVYNLTGNLMSKNQAIELIDQIKDDIAEDKKLFIADFSAMEYLNSSGINVLVNVFTLIRNAGGELVICCVSEKVQQLFIITKLNTVFNIEDTVDQAFDGLLAISTEE